MEDYLPPRSSTLVGTPSFQGSNLQTVSQRGESRHILLRLKILRLYFPVMLSLTNLAGGCMHNHITDCMKCMIGSTSAGVQAACRVAGYLGSEMNTWTCGIEMPHQPLLLWPTRFLFALMSRFSAAEPVWFKKRKNASSGPLALYLPLHVDLRGRNELPLLLSAGR